MHQSAQSRSNHDARSRRGSVYVLVLGLVMLMVLTGTGAVMAARARIGAITIANDSMAASVLAESAIEYALTALSTDANWRTTYTSGVESSKIALGSGTITFKVVDEVDGKLNNNTSDPVRIYGYGRVGNATQAFSVVAAGADPLTCLNAPLVVGGNFSFIKFTANATGMTLASNGNISDGSSGGTSTINGNLESCGTINLINTTFNGTKSSGVGVTPRDLPKASVFDPYIAAGTAIPYTSLPAYSGGGRAIQSTVLAPNTNPYSILSTNALGIYVIDCANQKITILNCRIVGTLVLLNPGAGSSIGADGVSDEVNWVPAVTNYPCLLVKGDIKIAFGNSTTAELKETTAIVNYNLLVPYPYPSGTINLLTSDKYPSRIQGLVYVSGNVTGSQSGGGTFPRVDTLIVGGNYTPSNDTIYPVYSTMYMTYPPPGFTGSGTPKPQAGTWRRETVP